MEETKIELNLSLDDGNVLYKGISPNFGKPYNVFDGDTITNPISISDKKDNYIGYNFNQVIHLSSYTIHPWFAGVKMTQVNCPTSWTLQGSNDNINWTDIETRTNMSSNWGSFINFKLQKLQDFTMFRLYNINAYGYPGIYEIEFFYVDKKERFLIKQGVNYYTIDNTGLTKILELEGKTSLTQEDYLTYGFEGLNNLNNHINSFTGKIKILRYIEKKGF